MDFAEIYHLVFESYIGIGILVGSGIVISIIACIIFELRTRRIYKNHEVAEEDEWSFFDEVIESEHEEEEVEAAAKVNR